MRHAPPVRPRGAHGAISVSWYASGRRRTTDASAHAAGAQVPAADAGALVQVDHDRPGRPQPGRASSMPSRSKSAVPRLLERAQDPVSVVLGGDEVLRASPSACARCRCRRTARASSSRSTGRGRGGRARGRAPRRRHRVDLGRRSEHLLVEVVDLAVRAWKLRQKPPRRKRASGAAFGLARRAARRETIASSGGSAHWVISDVGAGRARRRGRPAGGRSSQPDGVTVVSQSAFSSSAVEEPLHPARLAPAVLEGRRPGAELLAVVAHHPEPVARPRSRGPAGTRSPPRPSPNGIR